MKKNLLLLVSLCLVSILCFGCGGNTATPDKEAEAKKERLKIGVTGGPHETIMTKVAQLAAQQGLDVEIVSFSDYIQPNAQLDEGQLDLNAMQHAPFFEDAVSTKGYKLSNIGENILIPMCILSETVTDLSQVPDGSLVGIPNDTTNMARALQLLQSAGLIELNPEAGIMATTADITSNPHQLQFKELEAGMLLRALSEFSIAVINSNYVVEAGLIPNEEALFVEKTENNPWVNIFACQQGRENDAAIVKLIEIYQSDEIKQFIDETYQGAVIAAW